MVEIQIANNELAPPSQSGEDAINIINEYVTPSSPLSDKLSAAIALALLDVADAIRNS